MQALKAAFVEYGNPFLETSDDLLVLDTKDVADKAIVDTLCTNLKKLVVNSTAPL